MHVAHLSLRDYRNYQTAELALFPGPQLIVGPNGQGKTNLVESVVYLGTLGSHRVAGDAALVRSGADAAIVRARITFEERSFTVEVQINRAGSNRAQVNGSAVRPRELPRYVSSVLFAPEDLSIIRGDPAGRRRYLDEILVMHSPRLAGVMADYERVVRQRNTLLKSARASRIAEDQLGTLHLWDERLIEFGSEIMAERSRLVRSLRSPLRDAYAAVAGVDHSPSLVLRFSALASSADAEDEPAAGEGDGAELPREVAAEWLRDAIARFGRAERERGVTLCGPHRDDLLLSLKDLPVKGYASHGETWSFALAMKLAAAQLLRADSVSGDPVLVLDDVFAELDEGRRERLARAIEDFEQVLITAAVEADVPRELRRSVTRISAGSIVEDTAHD